MPTPRCRHGNDAPRHESGQCVICHRERARASVSRRKDSPEFRSYRARIARELRRKQSALRIGYTTCEAAEMLALEMRDLLSRAPDLARIYKVPDLVPVRTADGYRWPRAAVDAVRVTMFQDSRRSPTSRSARFA